MTTSTSNDQTDPGNPGNPGTPEHPGPTGNPGDPRLGQGRSGVVFRSRDDQGRDIARKVFDSDSLTNLVHYIFNGSPNAYVWCESAVHCAVLRRRILDTLLPYWFDDRLRVAKAYGYNWNTDYRAWQMNTQFIDGTHLQLHHPYRFKKTGQLNDAINHVMRPLQKHLQDAGFDGLVWQAGRGNPVALNNILYDGQAWVWIDLESGVPALAPLNPIDLVTFYIPKSFHHGRPLFDDVDLIRLRQYFADHRDNLMAKLTEPAYIQMQCDVDALSDAQRQWKAMARHVRAIRYRLGRGQLTQDQADFYTQRPVLWYMRESRRASISICRKVGRLAARLGRAVVAIDWRQLVKNAWGLISSQTFRVRTVRKYIASRIDTWHQRKQLDAQHAADLHQRLQNAETSRYLIDFGAHIAVKPFVKTLQWWVALTALLSAHSEAGALLILFGGAVIRTLYTLGRCIQNALKRREVPYLALFIGLLPVIGNLAFPLQIIFTSAHEKARIAQFLVYDTFTRIGHSLPIWGGPDTFTEHFFNRLPDHLMHYLIPDHDHQA